MPKPGAAPRTYRCRLCGEVVTTFGELSKHRAAAHPDTLPSRERIDTMARSIKGERTGSRRIEDVSGAARPAAAAIPPAAPSPGGDGTGAADPAAPPSPEPETGGRLRPSRPQLSQPTIRLSPEMERQGIADAVRDALPLQTVADLVRSLSVALSEADGAGEAGYLSPIQCTQVAFLIHDSTVGFVVSRFEGRVDRFKLAMAVIVILASKGTIHARAIGQKMAARQAARPQRVPLPADEPVEPTAIPNMPVAVAPEFVDTYAAAAERQAQMQAQGLVQ